MRSQITWLELLQLVLLELLQLVALGHQRQLELLLEQRLVLLFHKPRLHIRCWRHMLNRSCYHMMIRSLVCRSCYRMMCHSLVCRMMSHSLELLRSKLELERCSRLELVHSKKELVRSRLVLACSTLRGLACTSGLCT